MKLAERVSDRCLICGDFVQHRAGLLKDEEQLMNFKTSATTVRCSKMNSVSDVIDVCDLMESKYLKQLDNMQF